MAIGTISSPTQWFFGTVYTPTWGQNVQDNINAFIAGTESMKCVIVDGAGGAATTATAAQSGLAGAVPTFVPGALTRDLVPFAGGIFTLSATPSLTSGFNISNSSAISRTGTGTYTVTFQATASSTNLIGLVFPSQSSVLIGSVRPTSTSTVEIVTSTSGGAATDSGYKWSLLVYSIT